MAGHRGLSQVKEHKLLYYCQGHHLAVFDEPLFRETVSAWDMGPVVGTFWYDERHAPVTESSSALDEAQLNTVGYVISRYGGLTAKDLIKLTHAEDPWQLANQTRRPGDSVRIRHEWMRDYFRENSADDDDVLLDSEAVTQWLLDAAADRASRPAPRVNSREEILARLARA